MDRTTNHDLGKHGQMTLPPEVIAQVQRILDHEAELALAAERERNPTGLPLPGGRRRDRDRNDARPHDRPAPIES